MLQLKRSKSNDLELSDRKQTVELSGRTVKLGETTIDSAGEYEQGGVEVIFAVNAALLVWDHMQIAYVFSTDKPDAFEKNQFSSTDILILSEEITECSKDQLSTLTEVYDPRVIIFGAKTAIEEGFVASLKTVEQDNIKLAQQTLPTEGRDHIILLYSAG